MQLTSFVTVWSPNLQFRSVVRSPCLTRRVDRKVTCSRNTICATSSSEQKFNANLLARSNRRKDQDDSSMLNDDDSFIVDILEDDDDSNYDGVPFDEPYTDVGDLEFEGGHDDDIDDSNVIDVSVPQREKRLRKRTSSLIESISTQPVPGTAFTADADEMPDIESDEIAEYVRTAASAADERKGENIVALRVSKLTEITSFIVIISAKNTPQMRAISNLVEESIGKKHGMEPRRTDGVPNSGWILLDCKLKVQCVLIVMRIFYLKQFR